ncbi:type VI secretion system contractile sheath small subunit [Paraliomyxa miuraensis]|uniref:type VI secretion system contractile sheath small subunit n=1 Tax=Paraliomyxa miuraensis TaxID=376150 RepID=UPI00224D33E3|nr:type VI secretion system contractile sheath small subunit [Paraliomyxa miuraensis]MCX4244128.1 type VI secretion system contractile sheath small subunit [Paraliomyxa miuraensis]
MSKPVPRSRLNITYRTRIDGVPKKAKLPMRFLVLGKLTNENRSLLSDRPMHSLMPGMKVDSFMQEMKVASPIEPKDLAVKLSGHLHGTVTGVFKKKPESSDRTGVVKLTGTAMVTGKLKDNGLGNFEGQVTLEGEYEFRLENRKIKLPRGGEEVMLTVQGIVEPPSESDFEAGITGSIDTKLVFKIAESTLSDSEEDLALDLKSPLESQVPVALTIPLRCVSDFHPDNVAERVPEIRRLLLLRRLALELRSYVSSNPQLSVMLRDMLDKTGSELARAKKNAHVDVATAKAELDEATKVLEEGQKALAAATDDAGKVKAQRELERMQDKLREAEAKHEQAKRNEDVAARRQELEDGPKKALADQKAALQTKDAELSKATADRDAALVKRDEASKAHEEQQRLLEAAQKKVDEATDDTAKAEAETERADAQAKVDEASTKLNEEQTALDKAQGELDNAETAFDEAQDELDEAKAALAAAQAEYDAKARLSQLTTVARLKNELVGMFPLLMVEPPRKATA